MDHHILVPRTLYSRTPLQKACHIISTPCLQQQQFSVFQDTHLSASFPLTGRDTTSVMSVSACVILSAAVCSFLPHIASAFVLTSPRVAHGSASSTSSDHVRRPAAASCIEPVPSRRKPLRHRGSLPLYAAVSTASDVNMPAADDEASKAASDAMLAWAKDKYPGCSTVVSQTTRLSGLLEEVWETLADRSAVTDDSPRVLVFPDCQAVAEARGLQSLYEHLEVCQDACENFGTMVSIVPHPKGGKTDAPAAALVVQAVAGAGGGDEFDYDPDWDGDWDIDRSLLDDDDNDDEGGVGSEGGEVHVDAAALGVVPGSDEEVTELTKSWVQAVITDMGVCPFSVDASRAGLPIGQVRYPVTRETSAEAIYREYWREVELLVSETDERSLSTTLLITPEFALSNAEAFEVMGQTLTQPLEALHLEDDIQLVFFHPQYAFRDGRDRIGSGGAANFARRSPFPMINILRTNQVRLAQKSIPTGLVYKQNEEVLEEVGVAPLQKMLEKRDWAGLEGKKVDRKRVDYYETARKLQGMDGMPATPTADESSSSAGTTDAPPSSSDTEDAVDVKDAAGDVDDAAVADADGPDLADADVPADNEAFPAKDFSAMDRSGTRESLAAAVQSMGSGFAQGFSKGSSDDDDRKKVFSTENDNHDGDEHTAPAESAADRGISLEPQAAASPPQVAAKEDGIGIDEDLPPPTPVEEGFAAGVSTEKASTPTMTAGATGTGAAPNSAGIVEGDLRTLATAIVRRMGSGVPMTPDAFKEFSEAVDRVLSDTIAP